MYLYTSIQKGLKKLFTAISACAILPIHFLSVFCIQS